MYTGPPLFNIFALLESYSEQRQVLLYWEQLCSTITISNIEFRETVETLRENTYVDNLMKEANDVEEHEIEKLNNHPKA